MEKNSNIKTIKYSEYLKQLKYNIYYIIPEIQLFNDFFNEKEIRFNLNFIITRDNYNACTIIKKISGTDLNLVLRQHYHEFLSIINDKIEEHSSFNFFIKKISKPIKTKYKKIIETLNILNSIDINSDEGVKQYFKIFFYTKILDTIDLNKKIKVNLDINVGDKVYLTKITSIKNLFEGITELEIKSINLFNDNNPYESAYLCTTKNGDKYNFTINQDGSLKSENADFKIYINKEDAISFNKNVIDELVREKALIYF